jgi:hypothetical protein
MNPAYTMLNTDHAKNVILSAAAPDNTATATAAPAALNTLNFEY